MRTMRERYEEFLRRREYMKNDYVGKMWFDQEKRYVHPFKIYGNVWYVGDSWVCVHLIDTGDGLLLIDAGNCGATAMLVNAIWEAGFNPADVKWIVLSHGHLDHFGAVNYFRNMYGTQIYLGEPDARMYRENPEFSYVQDAGCDYESLCMPDVEIGDGDVITFGNTTMTFYLVPGHTMGTIACFFDTCDGDDVKRCGYYGGFGFNTLARDYLIEIGDTEYKTRQVYLDSLAKVRTQNVDIYLGNHTINNDTLGRRKKQMENPDGPNPFVDSQSWGDYLDKRRDELLKFMKEPANN